MFPFLDVIMPINLANMPYFFLRSLMTLSASSPVIFSAAPFTHSFFGSPLNEQGTIRTF